MTENNKPKRSYTADFKIEAVARSKRIGKVKTCSDLGIAPSTLHGWIKKNPNDNKILEANKPSYEDLEKENTRLKKELGYVEEINRVLKKSTAIFSSKELGGLK